LKREIRPKKSNFTPQKQAQLKMCFFLLGTQKKNRATLAPPIEHVFV